MTPYEVQFGVPSSAGFPSWIPGPSIKDDPWTDLPVLRDSATGATISNDYVSGSSSAQQQRDDNLGFLNQLFGSLTGENQKVLQDLMAAAAKSQYDYSERLSSTAYQRAVADMKAAGLNPAVMFAGSSGSAASTPQVGIASVATENQLISFISSAAKVITSIGSILSAIPGLGSLGSVAKGAIGFGPA